MALPQNKLSLNLAKLEKLPAPVASFARTQLMGRMVKFVGTAGLRIEALTEEHCVATLANASKVQNHIGSVHAAAIHCVPASRIRESTSTRSRGWGNSNVASSGTGLICE